jgi:hypothetical protein
LVVDEFSPIGSSRATVNPGIYMPQNPQASQDAISSRRLERANHARVCTWLRLLRLASVSFRLHERRQPNGELDRSSRGWHASVADLFVFSARPASTWLPITGGIKGLHWWWTIARLFR